MNEKRTQGDVSDRRQFVKEIGGAAVGAAFLCGSVLGEMNERPSVTTVDVQISNGITIVADNGTKGSFSGSRSQDLETLKSSGPQIRELLVGRDPFDRSLSGAML